MDLSIYATASAETELGVYRQDIRLLPNDIGSLCRFVQNLLVHAYWLDRYSLHDDETDKWREMQARSVINILDLAVFKSNTNIRELRKPKDKVVSICRDFSLLLCAVLREKQVPARVRCGFATYLGADHFEDHWVCEYWDVKLSRWVLVDAQLDEIHRRVLQFNFNALDVPKSAFLYAGEAWCLCRTGKLSADRFGIFDLSGLAFIKGNLIRDLFALATIELMAWDTGWGLLKDYITPIDSAEEFELLDDLAVFSQTSNIEKAITAVKTQPGIQLPSNWSFSDFPTIEVLYSKLN